MHMCLSPSFGTQSSGQK
ncbi:unnamed protein product [Staurois parvus]|uniref:Uncharacterized protein n=1 Tax=Staurois parvus TaxID=386267 RepID=A0ABN9DJP2_9NEOB|nr:unnamed protein product [Staurois parvus]